jgi:hypothetical protein
VRKLAIPALVFGAVDGTVTYLVLRIPAPDIALIFAAFLTPISVFTFFRQGLGVSEYDAKGGSRLWEWLFLAITFVVLFGLSFLPGDPKLPYLAAGFAVMTIVIQLAYAWARSIGRSGDSGRPIQSH